MFPWQQTTYPCWETTIKASHHGPFNKHTLSGVTWWVLGYRDQADSTQHREELNSLYTGLYTGLYTSLYHIRFIYQFISHTVYIVKYKQGTQGRYKLKISVYILRLIATVSFWLWIVVEPWSVAWYFVLSFHRKANFHWQPLRLRFQVVLKCCQWSWRCFRK